MANNEPVTEERLIAIFKNFRKDLNDDFQETLAKYHEEEIIPRLDGIMGLIKIGLTN